MDQWTRISTMTRKANRYNDPDYIDSIAHYNERHKPIQEPKNNCEETGELDGTAVKNINNLGLNSLNVANTRFVVSTTATVPEHEFSQDSSDEDVDENFNQLYNQSDCINGSFPFTPVTKTTTKVTSKDIILDDKKLKPLNVRTNSRVVNSFLEKIQRNGFEISENNKIFTLAVSIGLNRMYSVSSRKNNLLNLELQSTINVKNIKYETFDFYWTCKWNNIHGKEVEFEKVKRFYKQLKKVNPDLAKRFLIKEQEFARNRAKVPYQDIREYAKNHEKTKNLIAKFRADNPNAIIYLSLIDVDVLDFNGIFSAYLRIVNGCHEIPTIMTTGYEFPNESRAFELFSHMERMIRVITALYIPLGTYYPEPNMCIFVPPKCDTVPESFIDRKRGNKGKTQESPVLITAIQNNRGSAVRAIFSEDSPVIVTIPDRAKTKKQSKEVINFSLEFTSGPANPLETDIALYDEVSQSHSKDSNWLSSLFINNAFQYDKNHETDDEDDANIYDLPKRVDDRQCKKLIEKMKYNEDVNSVEHLKSKLARRIGEDDANNIAKAIETEKKYNEYFYEQHARTPEEQELIDIMNETSADFMKLPKGFLLRIVTSPIMSLIKDNIVDIVVLCQQDTEVIEKFIDDRRISEALEKRDVEFKDLIACLDKDIDDVDNPIAALLMKEDESVDIVYLYHETVGYALENEYIDEEDVRQIRKRLLGGREESNAEQEFQMYYLMATEFEDDYGQPCTRHYKDPSDPIYERGSGIDCGMSVYDFIYTEKQLGILLAGGQAVDSPNKKQPKRQI